MVQGFAGGLAGKVSKRVDEVVRLLKQFSGGAGLDTCMGHVTFVYYFFNILIVIRSTNNSI